MFPLINLGPIQIPSFFLWISIICSLSLFWIRIRAKSYDASVTTALDLSLVVMIAGLIGGRLAHVLYEEPQYYFANPVKIFFLWEGGFVFYGGLLFALPIGIAFLRIRGELQKNWPQIFAPVLCFAYGFGRVGCFLAGCCFGKTCSLPWAIAGRHPTQLYSFFWELGVLFILLGYEQKTLDAFKKDFSKTRQKKNPISLFWLWILLSSLGRFWVEFYRDDFRGPSYWLSISSWISLVMLAISIWRLRKKPI